jgi:hypothetical protein
MIEDKLYTSPVCQDEGGEETPEDLDLEEEEETGEEI